MDFVDCHHHFFDPAENSFQTFLRSLGIPYYLPEQYEKEVVQDLSSQGRFAFIGSVIVEAMPDEGKESDDVQWIESLIAAGAPIKAIVAACDITAGESKVKSSLDALAKASPTRLRGVRWILDHDGSEEFPGNGVTHVACAKRHGCDYVAAQRGPNDGPEKLEEGLAVLATRGLSFELQCAPEQLGAAATILARQPPSLKVIVNHIGKPRLFRDSSIAQHVRNIDLWRNGMAKLATLPNVHVKISMLGFAVPGWWSDAAKRDSLKGLVLETLHLFGANRCMVATNWHINAAVSDGDGLTDTGPSASELLATLDDWFIEFGCSETERKMLFAGTASKVYRL